MKTTILTLSLLMCLGSMVYSYPGRYEIARQQQGTDVEYEMKVLAQILENKMQAEEEFEEGAMQEDEARAKWIGKSFWKKVKDFVIKIIKDLYVPGPIYLPYLRNRDDKCRQLVGSGRKISTTDTDTGRSCDDTCKSSGEEGLTWQCKSGYNQLRSLKISCDSTKNGRTFCCCVEANTNMQFHF